MEDMAINKKFWHGRRTFVTGATGLVGGVLIRRLIDAGADVVCLIRDHVPKSQFMRPEIFNKVIVVEGDVRKQALMERIMGEYEINTVIHLAAQTIVGIANRNPISTFETNIKGSWCVFEACRRSPTVKQIVFASSDKAYGEAEKLPYDESTPLIGRYPYDVSKSCADLLAISYAKSYNLPIAITRCGNFFGGGDLNWNRIVPGTIKSVLKGTNPVIRSDGTFIRDYFYIEDGANAYMLLAEKLAENPELRGNAFNFSNESQMTVVEMANKIIKLMKSDLTPKILNEATNEIKSQYLNSSKAKKILNWHPLYSLDEGLLKTIDWYKDFFKNE